MSPGPALVSILRQGSYLVASVHTALDDSEMLRFQHDLIEQIGQYRSRFKTLRTIADVARLRGAETVIVGIQPDVAFAMVQLGMANGEVATALDLEEGLVHLGHVAPPPVGQTGGP